MLHLSTTDILTNQAAERIVRKVDGMSISRALDELQRYEVDITCGRLRSDEDKGLFIQDGRLKQGDRLAAVGIARRALLETVVVDARIPALSARLDTFLAATRGIA